jgi:uncharacterized protein (DUF362 family)
MSKVAVLLTSPERVLEDYKRLLQLAGLEKILPKETATLLKINISWHHWYPACSTTPWQLEGVIKTLLSAGFPRDNIIGAHNKTVVVSDRVGEVYNKHKLVTDKYAIPMVYLNEEDVQWERYKPKGEMLVLDKVFPKGILIPKLFRGKSIIHLPTMKTHVFTTITGAMKNAFGGLLSENRHWTHSVIHETLVDLLTIQKEIHPAVFAVMDATFAGEGPGPRCMIPHVKNYILASEDQVAIDAISAKMQGFDPISLKFIRLAHEKGLGCGDPNQIEIIGEDISEVNFRFKCGDTLASKGQKVIYHGFLKTFEHLLLRTAIVPWSFFASRLYHDLYWYPFIGKKRVKEMQKTGWGQLFLNYR